MDHENELERIFEAEKDAFKHIPLSPHMDLHIELGIQKAKRLRRLRRRKWSACAAVAILFFSFIFSVRVSTSFASAVSRIPVLEQLVKLIGSDPGLTAAVENEFMQPIGLSQVHDGVKFTVDGIIVDEGRMNVFYTVESPEAYAKPADAGHFHMTDLSGRTLEATISYGSAGDDQEKGRILHNRVDINLVEGKVFPDRVILEAGITQSGEWKIEFPIDHTRFAHMKEKREINSKVEVAGQAFTIVRATIYPTRIAVEIAIDPSNSMQIFAFHNLELVNENGERLSSYLATGSGSDLRRTVYFQSNYFTRPKELYLTGEHIMALDKEQLELKLSLSEQKVLKAPTDQVSIESVQQTKNEWKITMKIKGLSDWDHHGYNIVGQSFHDAAGQAFEVSSGGGTLMEWSSHEDEETRYIYLPGEQAYADPLTFEITDYPTYISKPFKVRIK